MKTVSFIAEMGNPGADGTTINLAGLGFPERPVKLLANFNTRELVGFCEINKVACQAERGLLVQADVPEHLLDCYPAISFREVASEPNDAGGRTITACVLGAVSLNTSPNADPAIKTIRDQLANA